MVDPGRPSAPRGGGGGAHCTGAPRLNGRPVLIAPGLRSRACNDKYSPPWSSRCYKEYATHAKEVLRAPTGRRTNGRSGAAAASPGLQSPKGSGGGVGTRKEQMDRPREAY